MKLKERALDQIGRRLVNGTMPPPLISRLLSLASLTPDDLEDWLDENEPGWDTDESEPEDDADPDVMSINLWSGYDDLSDRATLITRLHGVGGPGPEWQIEQVTAGTAIAVRGVPSPRPSAETVRLGSDAKPTSAPDANAAAEARGRVLVEWNWEQRRVVTAVLSPQDRDLRARIADALKVAPWDIDLTTTWAVDTLTGRGRLATVTINRAPLLASAARRATTWAEIAENVVPGGSKGWTIRDEPQSRRVVLAHGKPPRLPQRLELAAIMPDTFSPADWARLPLGVGPDGQTIGVDLTAGPHCLIAGPTGSGKSAALLTLVSGALARGHRLIVIDPMKGGADFSSVRPWTLAWAVTLAEAQATLEAVYAEAMRRKEIVLAHGVVKWSDLPAEVRLREKIGPLTVLLDEFGSMVLEEGIPKSLDKTSDYAIEAAERDTHRAIIKVLVGKVARECRFVGIHLQIALQRPDVSVMGSGELRSNLSSAIQIVPPSLGVSRDALAMVFNGAMVPSAEEEIALLDDGSSMGLAIVAGESGRTQGLRVAYTPKHLIPALLDELGVPTVEPWPIAGSSATLSSEPTGPAVVELPSMEFSLDDLLSFDDPSEREPCERPESDGDAV